MTILEIIFWLILFLIFYTYIGYGVVVFMLVKIKKLFNRAGIKPADTEFEPEVTLVIPAYNELSCIEDKLRNTLEIDYPSEKLKVLFVTEGSTDGTTEWLEKKLVGNPGLQLISGTERRGKIEAMNRAIKLVKTPIVIFSDANTHLNTAVVKNLVRHFADEGVGAVAGEKRVLMDANEAAAGAGEGLYWKYESFLKKLDTELHTVVGAAGELFAVRTPLFGEVEKDTLLDDFIISLRIAADGYRVVYEPDAYASEKPSFSIADEMKRKVRIAAGGFQAMARLLPLINIFRYGWLSFQYISHRAMRWAVTPFCLPALVLVNIALVNQPTWLDNRLYQLLLVGQVAFYLLSVLGYYLESRRIRVKLLFVPFYFSFMNYCAIKGYFRYKNGIASGIWEKVNRAV